MGNFRVLVTAAASIFALSAVAQPQPYPSKPLRIIVGFAPGGAVDTIARITAQRLTDSLGRTAVVENRPGASTNIAAELVAKAAPDGYTLLMGSSSNATNMTLF